MKRTYPIDHEFDRAAFARLLKVAQGKRTQKQFAEDIPMSSTYLCAFLGAKQEKPLIPEMLNRIAFASENRVSFSDLLYTSGYDPEKFIDKPYDLVIKYSEKNPLSFEAVQVVSLFDRLNAAISNALVQQCYCIQKVNEESTIFDLSIKMVDAPISIWHFIFVGYTGNSDQMKSIEISSYGSELLTKVEPQDKVSFVTTNKIWFDDMVSQSLPSLQTYISIVLIDSTGKDIIQETYIKTAANPVDTIPSLL